MLPADDLFGLCSRNRPQLCEVGRELLCAPKALPALGSCAAGGSPSSLQHLQGQAEEKALESHSHPTR